MDTRSTIQYIVVSIDTVRCGSLARAGVRPSSEDTPLDGRDRPRRRRHVVRDGVVRHERCEKLAVGHLERDLEAGASPHVAEQPGADGLGVVHGPRTYVRMYAERP